MRILVFVGQVIVQTFRDELICFRLHPGGAKCGQVLGWFAVESHLILEKMISNLGGIRLFWKVIDGHRQIGIEHVVHRGQQFDSVLVARDKFLRPGGALYPSHCHLYIAPCRTPCC